MLWILVAGVASVLQIAIFLALIRIWRSLGWLRKTLKANLQSVPSNERQQAEGRQYLATLLDQPVETLPPLGRWAASADFLIILAETILNEKRSQILPSFSLLPFI